MKRDNYPSWHEMKDLAMIYHEDEWDDAHVKVWDPENQREYNLSFCGSTRPQENTPGEINFVIYKKEANLTDDEKSINEYIDKEFSNFPDSEKRIYGMIFKRGIEYGKQISK